MNNETTQEQDMNNPKTEEAKKYALLIEAAKKIKDEVK